MSPRIPTALTVAGSDSGGGAGIQADLKTFAAHGVHGASAITAVTAQNTRGVQGIQDLPAPFVGLQMRSVLEDLEVAAAKTGMLSNEAIVLQVAQRFREFPVPHLVVDPVMVAKSGDPLLRPEARAALMEDLLPLASLVTPNLPEAAELAGRTVEGRDDMLPAAREILRLGAGAVLVKGGHLEGDEVLDLLLAGPDTEPRWFTGERIHTPHTHGTGCALSSAIAARLARGEPLEEAVAGGWGWLRRALARPVVPGRGIGHPGHLATDPGPDGA